MLGGSRIGLGWTVSASATEIGCFSLSINSPVDTAFLDGPAFSFIFPGTSKLPSVDKWWFTITNMNTNYVTFICKLLAG